MDPLFVQILYISIISIILYILLLFLYSLFAKQPSPHPSPEILAPNATQQTKHSSVFFSTLETLRGQESIDPIIEKIDDWQAKCAEDVKKLRQQNESEIRTSAQSPLKQFSQIEETLSLIDQLKAKLETNEKILDTYQKIATYCFQFVVENQIPDVALNKSIQQDKDHTIRKLRKECLSTRIEMEILRIKVIELNQSVTSAIQNAKNEEQESHEQIAKLQRIIQEKSVLDSTKLSSNSPSSPSPTSSSIPALAKKLPTTKVVPPKKNLDKFKDSEDDDVPYTKSTAPLKPKQLLQGNIPEKLSIKSKTNNLESEEEGWPDDDTAKKPQKKLQTKQAILDKFKDDEQPDFFKPSSNKVPLQLPTRLNQTRLEKEDKEEEDWGEIDKKSPVPVTTPSQPVVDQKKIVLERYQDKAQDEQVATTPLKISARFSSSDRSDLMDLEDEEEDWSSSPKTTKSVPPKSTSIINTDATKIISKKITTTDTITTTTPPSSLLQNKQEDVEPNQNIFTFSKKDSTEVTKPFNQNGSLKQEADVFKAPSSTATNAKTDSNTSSNEKTSPITSPLLADKQKEDSPETTEIEHSKLKTITTTTTITTITTPEIAKEEPIKSDQTMETSSSTKTSKEDEESSSEEDDTVITRPKPSGPNPNGFTASNKQEKEEKEDTFDSDDDTVVTNTNSTSNSNSFSSQNSEPTAISIISTEKPVEKEETKEEDEDSDEDTVVRKPSQAKPNPNGFSTATQSTPITQEKPAPTTETKSTLKPGSPITDKPSESEALHYMVDYFEKKFQFHLKIESTRFGTSFTFTEKESHAPVLNLKMRLDYNHEVHKYHLPLNLPLAKTVDRFDIQAHLEENLVKKIGVQKRASMKAFRSLALDHIEMAKEIPLDKFDFAAFAKTVVAGATKTSQKMVVEIREKSFTRVTSTSNIIFFQKQLYLIIKPTHLDDYGNEVDKKDKPINSLLIYMWIGRESELQQKFKTESFVKALQNSAKELKLRIAKSEIKVADTQLSYCKYFHCIRVVDGGLSPNQDIKQFCQEMDKKKRLYRVMFYVGPQDMKPHFVLLEMEYDDRVSEQGFYILDLLQHIYWYNGNLSQTPSSTTTPQSVSTPSEHSDASSTPTTVSTPQEEEAMLPKEISDVLKLGKDEFNVSHVKSVEEFKKLIPPLQQQE